MKILIGGKILEVGENPGDLIAKQRLMLGDVQGPWPAGPQTGTCKELHSRNWPSQTSSDLPAGEQSWDLEIVALGWGKQESDWAREIIKRNKSSAVVAY